MCEAAAPDTNMNDLVMMLVSIKTRRGSIASSIPATAPSGPVRSRFPSEALASGGGTAAGAAEPGSCKPTSMAELHRQQLLAGSSPKEADKLISVTQQGAGPKSPPPPLDPATHDQLLHPKHQPPSPPFHPHHIPLTDNQDGLMSLSQLIIEVEQFYSSPST